MMKNMPNDCNFYESPNFEAEKVLTVRALIELAWIYKEKAIIATEKLRIANVYYDKAPDLYTSMAIDRHTSKVDKYTSKVDMLCELAEIQFNQIEDAFSKREAAEYKVNILFT